MKETAILAFKLLLFTAVVAALLGAVNMITEPIIAANSEQQFNDNMKEVMPDADRFELDGTVLPEPEAGITLGDVYCGMKDDGTVVGYVSTAVCPEGYNGDISVMVGVNNDKTISRALVTEMSETPGLGAKCQSEWIDQFIGLGENISVSKNGSADSAMNKIDAISGATITSNAVTKAVNAVVDAAIYVINDNMPQDSVLQSEAAVDPALVGESADGIIDETSAAAQEQVLNGSEAFTEDEGGL